jgi:AraC-like DNA-binding protein
VTARATIRGASRRRGARVAAAFVHAAEREGLPREVLLARSRLEPASLADPDGRVLLRSVYALLEACLALGDELVHLRMTRRMEPATLDALAFLTSTSATFGEGVRAMLRYQRIFSEGERYEWVDDDEGARVVYQPWGAPRPAHRAMAEMFVVDLIDNGARLVGAPLEGVRVLLAHGAPRDRRAHAALLGVEASFDAPAYAIVIPSRVLAMPPASGGHAAMAAFFTRHLEEHLRALAPETTGARTIAALLRGGEADLETLASRLQMSPRTLQRRLADEGVSLRVLAEDARRARASALLEGGASIAEVAYTLGYSEPSAFHRAFRRWTRQTPEQFRASLDRGPRGSSARAPRKPPRA